MHTVQRDHIRGRKELTGCNAPRRVQLQLRGCDLLLLPCMPHLLARKHALHHRPAAARGALGSAQQEGVGAVGVGGMRVRRKALV